MLARPTTALGLGVLGAARTRGAGAALPPFGFAPYAYFRGSGVDRCGGATLETVVEGIYDAYTYIGSTTRYRRNNSTLGGSIGTNSRYTFAARVQFVEADFNVHPTYGDPAGSSGAYAWQGCIDIFRRYYAGLAFCAWRMTSHNGFRLTGGSGSPTYGPVCSYGEPHTLIVTRNGNTEYVHVDGEHVATRSGLDADTGAKDAHFGYRSDRYYANYLGWTGNPRDTIRTGFSWSTVPDAACFNLYMDSIDVAELHAYLLAGVDLLEGG
jgi:hypothetical protein